MLSCYDVFFFCLFLKAHSEMFKVRVFYFSLKVFHSLFFCFPNVYNFGQFVVFYTYTLRISLVSNNLLFYAVEFCIELRSIRFVDLM